MGVARIQCEAILDDRHAGLRGGEAANGYSLLAGFSEDENRLQRNLEFPEMLRDREVDALFR